MRSGWFLVGILQNYQQVINASRLWEPDNAGVMPSGNKRGSDAT